MATEENQTNYVFGLGNIIPFSLNLCSEMDPMVLCDYLKQFSFCQDFNLSPEQIYFKSNLFFAPAQGCPLHTMSAFIR